MDKIGAFRFFFYSALKAGPEFGITLPVIYCRAFAYCMYWVMKGRYLHYVHTLERV
jgi:hypothetical protein